MNITRHVEAPSMCNGKVCIGIALVGQDIRVAARAGGREIAHGCFPPGPLGTAALLSYLADWQIPLRLAVATAGSAALSLALAISAPHDREVFLVSALTIGVASELARYAERAI